LHFSGLYLSFYFENCVIKVMVRAGRVAQAVKAPALKACSAVKKKNVGQIADS
jgi:hypothetical protein